MVMRVMKVISEQSHRKVMLMVLNAVIIAVGKIDEGDKRQRERRRCRKGGER